MTRPATVTTFVAIVRRDDRDKIVELVMTPTKREMKLVRDVTTYVWFSLVVFESRDGSELCIWTWELPCVAWRELVIF